MQGDRTYIPPLSMQNDPFNPAGEDLFIQQFKLGKTEEEILCDLVWKLSIPTKPLSITPSLYNQS